MLPASDFPGLELPGLCDIIIPPAVRDEVGADTLALIIQSGIAQCNETAIAIDYGTNAEMALVHQNRLFTASAAAGPALEGQHITCGTLAVPGAIADLEPEGRQHRLQVLDTEMQVDGWQTPRTGSGLHRWCDTGGDPRQRAASVGRESASRHCHRQAA
jgi:uncharacterized 2Fe-2S/4Fe-4S cluster protein (DUF4445 family)